MLGRKDYTPADLARVGKDGNRISLSRAQFERLAKAFFAEIERKFLEVPATSEGACGT